VFDVSSKFCTLLPPDALISAQNAAKCVWCPGGPAGEASVLPQTLWPQKGGLLVREGEGRAGKGREGDSAK